MNQQRRVSGADAQRPALARCLSVPPEQFAAEHWARRPLLSRAGDAGRGEKSYDDLITLADVDELISRRGLRAPFLRMAKSGQVIPQSRYTGSGGAGAEIPDQALDERIVGLLADGATLVLQGLHRLWPPLEAYAGQLAAELGHPIGVNAYLTPPGNQGFDTHYDTHDVFVLQIAGAKRWRVHPPVVTDPLPSQPFGGRTEEIRASATAAPVIDTVLEPGDALYLPRGWLHSAAAEQQLSMHLTIGIFTVTRHALVAELLALAAEEPALRRSLPLGLDPGDPAQLSDELAETGAALADWLTRIDPEAVAARLRTKLWSQTRPAPLHPLAQASVAAAVSTTTRVALRPRLRGRLEQAGDAVVLRVFDRTVRFPGYCGEALRAVLDGAPLLVRELPGLDPADQLTLARRLLREAIVVPVDT